MISAIDVIGFVGFVVVGFGLWLVWPPLSLIFVGTVFMWLSIAATRNGAG